MNTRVSDISSTEWVPNQFHGEWDEDGESVYFAVKSADEDGSTILATYTTEAKFRELCAMFKVDDTIEERADG